MRLKWGNERLKGFSSPVKTVKENDWSWWAIFAAVVVMEVIFILKVTGKI